MAVKIFYFLTFTGQINYKQSNNDILNMPSTVLVLLWCIVYTVVLGHLGC